MAIKNIGSRISKRDTVRLEWIKNAAKSVGVVIREDVLNEYAPNITDTVKSGIQTSRNLATNLRKNRNGLTFINREIQRNQYVSTLNKALKHAWEDLKTGNLSGTFDVEDALGSANFDSNGTSASFDMSGLSNSISSVGAAISKSTDIQLKVQKASTDAMIAVDTAMMQQNAVQHQELLESLRSIDSNVQGILRYYNENLNSFIKKAEVFYDVMGKAISPDPSKSNNASNDSLFDDRGRLDQRQYLKYAKSRLGNVLPDEFKSFLTPDMVKMMMSNPLQFIRQMTMEKIMPDIVGSTLRGLDDAFTEGMSKFALKTANNWKNSNNVIKKYIGNVLGIDIEELDNTKKKMNARMRKGPIPFDGETKTAITEVITKELREQTQYLNIIASSLTGTSGKKLSAKVGKRGRVFDYESGKFTSVKDIDTQIAEAINNAISSSMRQSDFGKGMMRYYSDTVANSGSADSDASRTAKRDLDILFNLLANNTNANLSTSDIQKMIKDSNITNRSGIVKFIRNELNDSQRNGMVGAGINARRAAHSRMRNIEDDYTGWNLISSSFNDSDDVMKTMFEVLGFDKRIGVKTSNKANYNKNGPVESDADSVRRRFSSYFSGMNSSGAGIIDAILKGQGGDALYNSVADTITSGFKGIFNFVSDRLFGEKDSNGNRHGGPFSKVANTLKDATTEAIGNVKSVGLDIRNGILERFFNRKIDPETGKLVKANEDKESVVSKISSTFTEGFHGWADAFFGKEAKDEESRKKRNEELMESLGKALPNTITGAGFGLLTSVLAGGSLLGVLMGGPIGGVAIGSALGFASRSEKFQNWLFGEKDDNGERVGGLVSKKVQDYAKEHKSWLIGGAAGGAVMGTVTGGGLLGTLVGGPIAGALMGTAGSIVLKSKSFNKFLFGDEDNKGTITYIKEAFTKHFNKPGEDGEDHNFKGLGMGLIGAGFGAAIGSVGLMGAVMGPMGPIGGAIAGVALSIKASAGGFHDWLFGKKDENGEKIEGGLVGKIGAALDVNIIKPMKTRITYIGKDMMNVLEHKVLAPLGFVAEGLADKAGAVISRVGEMVADAKDGIVDNIKAAFAPLTNAVMETAGKVTDATWALVKGVVSIPGTIVSKAMELTTSTLGRITSVITSGVGLVVGTITGAAHSLVRSVTGVIGNVVGGVAKTVFKPVNFVADMAKAGLHSFDAKFGVSKLLEGTDLHSRIINNKRDFKNRSIQLKQERENSRRHDKNAKIIAKYTKGLYTEDSDEARDWLKEHRPNIYEKYFGAYTDKDGKTKYRGGATITKERNAARIKELKDDEDSVVGKSEKTIAKMRTIKAKSAADATAIILAKMYNRQLNEDMKKRHKVKGPGLKPTETSDANEDDVFDDDTATPLGYETMGDVLRRYGFGLKHSIIGQRGEDGDPNILRRMWNGIADPFKKNFSKYGKREARRFDRFNNRVDNFIDLFEPTGEGGQGGRGGGRGILSLALGAGKGLLGGISSLFGGSDSNRSANRNASRFNFNLHPNKPMKDASIKPSGNEDDDNRDGKKDSNAFAEGKAITMKDRLAAAASSARENKIFTLLSSIAESTKATASATMEHAASWSKTFDIKKGLLLLALLGGFSFLKKHKIGEIFKWLPSLGDTMDGIKSGVGTAAGWLKGGISWFGQYGLPFLGNVATTGLQLAGIIGTGIVNVMGPVLLGLGNIASGLVSILGKLPVSATKALVDGAGEVGDQVINNAVDVDTTGMTSTDRVNALTKGNAIDNIYNFNNQNDNSEAASKFWFRRLGINPVRGFNEGIRLANGADDITRNLVTNKKISEMSASELNDLLSRNLKGNKSSFISKTLGKIPFVGKLGKAATGTGSVIGKTSLGARNTMLAASENVGARASLAFNVKDVPTDKLLQDIIKMVDKVAKTVKEKFLKKFAGDGVEAFAKSAISKSAETIMKDFATNAKTIITKVGERIIPKLAAVTGTKTAAGLVSAGISEAIFGGINALNTASDAGTGKLFGISSGMVDDTEKRIAACWGFLSGTTPGSVVDILREFSKEVFPGTDFVRVACVALYGAVSNDVARKALDKAQDNWRSYYENDMESEYKAAYERGLREGTISKGLDYNTWKNNLSNDDKKKLGIQSMEEWNANKNKTFGSTLIDNIKSKLHLTDKTTGNIAKNTVLEALAFAHSPIAGLALRTKHSFDVKKDQKNAMEMEQYYDPVSKITYTYNYDTKRYDCKGDDGSTLGSCTFDAINPNAVSTKTKRQINNNLSKQSTTFDSSMMNTTYQVTSKSNGVRTSNGVRYYMPTSVPGGGGRGTDTLNGGSYFSQTDARWGGNAYGNDGSRMSDSGCGPTAMAMIANDSGINVSPQTMANFAVKTGDRDSTGTNWNFVDKASSALGLQSQQVRNPNADYLASQLASGNKIILSGASGGFGIRNFGGKGGLSPYTSEGHYVVAEGIDNNGNVIINDPRGPQYSGAYNLNDVANQTGSSWSFGGQGGRGKRTKYNIRFGGRGTKDKGTVDINLSNMPWAQNTTSIKTAAQGKKSYSREWWVACVRTALGLITAKSPKMNDNVSVSFGGKNYNMNCSNVGLIGAALAMFGIIADGVRFSYAELTNSKNKTLTKNGFRWHGKCSSFKKLNEGDIIVAKNNAEIVAFYSDKKLYTYKLTSKLATTPTVSSLKLNDVIGYWTPGVAGKGANKDVLYAGNGAVIYAKKISSGKKKSDGTDSGLDVDDVLTTMSNGVGNFYTDFISRALSGDWNNTDFSNIYQSTTGEDSEVASGSTGTSSKGKYVASKKLTKGPQHKKIWDFLTTKAGFTKNAAAGAMGCWQRESGNDPTKVEGYYLKGYPGFSKVSSTAKSMDNYVTGTLFPHYASSGLSINQGAYKASGHYYPGFGLAQWTGPRGKHLKEYGKNHGGDWRLLDTQLNFFLHANGELPSRKGLKKKMNAAKSPSEATAIFAKYFEGFNGDYTTRKQSANSIYKKYGGRGVSKAKQTKFINKIGNAAIKYYKEYQILPSFVIAQAICESGWGTSKLSKYHNYFGMKWSKGCGCQSVSMKTGEQKADGTYYTVTAKFRKYSSFDAGIKGYYKFLNYDRYKNLRGVRSYTKACQLIKQDGWATSINYTNTLINLIKTHKLYEWDKKIGIDSTKGSGDYNGKGATAGGESVKSKWVRIVKACKKAFATQCGVYSQSASSNIKVNGKSYRMRHDCTGFVGLCCAAMGYGDNLGTAINTRNMVHDSDAWVKLMKKKGWKKIKWPGWKKLKQGDILVRNGGQAHGAVFSHLSGGVPYLWHNGVAKDKGTSRYHTNGFDWVFRPPNTSTGGGTNIAVTDSDGGGDEDENVLTKLATGVSNFYTKLISNALAGKWNETDYSDIYKTGTSSASTTSSSVSDGDYDTSDDSTGSNKGKSSKDKSLKKTVFTDALTSSTASPTMKDAWKYGGRIVYDKKGRIRYFDRNYHESKLAIDKFKQTGVYQSLKAYDATNKTNFAGVILDDYSKNYKSDYKWKVPTGTSAKSVYNSKTKGYNSIVVSGPTGPTNVKNFLASNTSANALFNNDPSYIAKNLSKTKATTSTKAKIASKNITNTKNSNKKAANGDAKARGGRGAKVSGNVINSNNGVSSKALREYVSVTRNSDTNDILMNMVNILADIALSSSDASTKLDALENIKSLSGKVNNNYYSVNGGNTQLIGSNTNGSTRATNNDNIAYQLAKGGF